MPNTVLYDLSSAEGSVGWSPSTWKARLCLNYKGIDYETKFLDFPDVAPTLQSFGLEPDGPDLGHGTYTCPTLKFPDGEYIMDSFKIAVKMETFPEWADKPKVKLETPLDPLVEEAISQLAGPLVPNFMHKILDVLNPRSREHYARTRFERFGMSLEELHQQKGGEGPWEAALPAMDKIAELLKINDGPFLMGDRVSFSDFSLVALWQFLRRLDESIFERLMEHDQSLKELYQACQGWILQKQD